MGGTGTGTRSQEGVAPSPPDGTFQAQVVTDLDVFFSDFAVAATLVVGGSSTTVYVIFSAPFRGISPATGEIETTAPEARCKTSDVSTAVHGSTLRIAGVTYKVIGKQPGEDNLETILVLSKD